jgi:alpha-glucosidase
MHARSGGVDPGRDGCRVPLPWSGMAPPYGFSRVAVEPWLPQPGDWAGLTAEAQAETSDSMLALYRTGLRLRREHNDLGSGTLAWLDLGPDVIAFRRGHELASVTNLSGGPVDLPPSEEILLASAPVEGGHLPVDATAWLRLE